MLHHRRSIILVLLAAAPARADDPKARAAFVALYESATTHYDLGEFAESLKDLTAAFRLRRDPALLFNIAQCHRQLGNYGDAARTYRSFLREQPDAPNRPEVEKRIADMDREAAAAVQRAQAAKPPESVLPTTPPVVQRPAPAPVAEPARPVRPARRDLPAIGFGAGALVLAAVGLGVAGDGLGAEGRAGASGSVPERARLLSQASTEEVVGGVLLGVAVVCAAVAIVRAVVWHKEVP
jgi:tetratricopeptide (TPR) repeat protein